MNARVDTGLAGQHAVVTGGGRGIGAAIAGGACGARRSCHRDGPDGLGRQRDGQVAQGQFQDARARGRL